MAQRLAKRLLIVGWDAADWKIIDHLLSLDRLPNLRRVVDGGVRGDLATLQPMLSPMLWTSIATGKTADKHGILNFIEPDPSSESGALRLITSTSRRVKALWNILTQAGLSTNVVGWYATHPAEPIRGAVVSNLFQQGCPPTMEGDWPVPRGAVHPEELEARVAELRLHPHEIDPRELLSLLPKLEEMDPRDGRLSTLVKLLAEAASMNNVGTWLLRNRPADCTMVFFELIDVVGHHFMRYAPPRMAGVSEVDFERYRHVVHGVYQFQDLMLGSMLEAAGPETTVIVLSDHGFHSDHLRPAAAARLDDEHAAMDATWHRPLGVLAMAGPGVRSGERVYGANILDVAPTALTLLGLAVGADMDGRVLVEALLPGAALDRVFSWDTLEGEAGLHPADLRVDPVEARSAMQQLADLGYILPPSAAAADRLAVLKREVAFNLATVYMTTRRVTEALPIFERLAVEHPGEPRFALNAVQCYFDRGRFADARRVLAEFLRLNPDHPDGGMFLGLTLAQEGKPEEAMPHLRRAEERFPDRADVLSTLGWGYIVARHPDEARLVLERARALDPHEPRTHHTLALVALEQERFDAAVEHCLDALDVQHVYADAHHTLGVALTWMKDFPRAIQAFQSAISMQPGLIDAHRFLASIYRHLGDRVNAPKHRKIAEELIAQRDAGREHRADFLREPPMGPLDWSRRTGLPAE